MNALTGPCSYTLSPILQRKGQRQVDRGVQNRENGVLIVDGSLLALLLIHPEAIKTSNAARVEGGPDSDTQT